MKLEVTDLAQGYGDNTVIDGIDLTVESGEVVTLLGPNGSGKSTMVKTICGVMERRRGSITIDGVDIDDYDKNELAKIVAYVPQKNDFFGFSTVYDSVLIGRKPYVKWSYSKDDIHIAAESMIAMNIQDLYDRPVQNLSGGQLQRVTLARALTQQPQIYVFDEPTSALDLRNQLDTLKLMRAVINRDNSCMLIALHDLNLALRYSDKVLAIKNGKTYKFGKTEDVIDEKMIYDIYGVQSEIIDTPHGKFVHAIDTDLDVNIKDYGDI